MRDGKLSRLWDGAKVLPNLKFMDLSYSDQLTSTPDFTGIPNLEILWLDFCTSLVEVHPYVAVLKKLRYLDLTEKSGSAKRGKVVSNLCVLPIPPPTYRLNPCGKVSNQLYLTMDDLADKFGIGSLRLSGNPSVGDSITVELPLPPHPSNSSDWVGIALCVVFDDSEYFDSPASLLGYEDLKIEVRSSQRYLDDLQVFLKDIWMISSEHLGVFYLPRDHPSLTDASTSHRFSFVTHYSSIRGLKELKTSSIIKECRARLVYKRDLEEFSRLMYCDEAGPIGRIEVFNNTCLSSSFKFDEKKAMHWWHSQSFKFDCIIFSSYIR